MILFYSGRWIWWKCKSRQHQRFIESIRKFLWRSACYCSYGRRSSSCRAWYCFYLLLFVFSLIMGYVYWVQERPEDPALPGVTQSEVMTTHPNIVELQASAALRLTCNIIFKTLNCSIVMFFHYATQPSSTRTDPGGRPCRSRSKSGL